MNLTDEERAMADGQFGEPAAEAIRFQIELGQYYDADGLIRINQVSNDLTYAMHHDFGLETVERFAGAGTKFRCFVKIGKLNMDMEKWRELGTPHDIAEKQVRLHDAYVAMGGIPYYTSLPVLMPHFGESIVWGGSNTCLLANSHIGARANLESPLSGLMAAVTGRTPRFGLHLSENRRANIIVKTEAQVANSTDWDALGYATGKKVSGYTDVPVFVDLPKIKSMGERQRFDSSLVSYGTMGMYHIVGATPEAPSLEAALGGNQPRAEVVVTQRDLKATYDEFDLEGEVDVVAFGGHHLTIDQFPEIVAKLEGRKVHENVRLWLFTSPQYRSTIERMGYGRAVEAAGGQVVYDTSLIFMVSEAFAAANGISRIISDSAKMCHYLGGSKVEAAFRGIGDCIDIAVSGRV